MGTELHTYSHQCLNRLPSIWPYDHFLPGPVGPPGRGVGLGLGLVGLGRVGNGRGLGLAPYPAGG